MKRLAATRSPRSEARCLVLKVRISVGFSPRGSLSTTILRGLKPTLRKSELKRERLGV